MAGDNLPKALNTSTASVNSSAPTSAPTSARGAAPSSVGDTDSEASPSPTNKKSSPESPRSPKIAEEAPAAVCRFKATTAEDRGKPTGNAHGEWGRFPPTKIHISDSQGLPTSVLRSDTDPKKNPVSSVGSKEKMKEEFWNMRRASARAMPTGNPRGEWKFAHSKLKYEDRGYITSTLRNDGDPAKILPTDWHKSMGKSTSSPEVGKDKSWTDQRLRNSPHDKGELAEGVATTKFTISVVRTDIDSQKNAESKAAKDAESKGKDGKEFWNMRRASARAFPTGNPQGEWNSAIKKVGYPVHEHVSTLRADTDKTKSPVTVPKAAYRRPDDE
mmetsp:Transcript_98879/g.176152  ORF Transcript_98879/g.176152 Transcript_98879/m.176152 type:complete len:330 (-) Transcript_98879:30-1019(-)